VMQGLYVLFVVEKSRNYNLASRQKGAIQL